MAIAKRPFGDAGFDVSEIGLGCWQLGGLCWGDMDERSAFDILAKAVETGVTFFDTADVYGEGRSETLIGKFLAEEKPDIVVATKIGRFGQGWSDLYSRETMRAHVDESLGRLGVDALDLAQLHCIPTEIMEQGDVFDTLRELKEDGKIKHWGVSVESMDEALLCLNQEGIASLQIIFNIFRQKPISELFEHAKSKDVALIARVPLASGLLAGKMTLDHEFPENDHRRFNQEGESFNVGETFAGLPFQTGVDLTNQAKEILGGGVMAQQALRWILDHDAISVVIPGASSLSQVGSNSAASSMPPLSKSLHKKLEKFYRNEVHDHIRGPY
jgi:aryl-alcohol dehydrogenase-like predicted oxidoreductase